MLQPMIGLMITSIEACAMCEHLSFSKQREIIHSYMVQICVVYALCVLNSILRWLLIFFFGFFVLSFRNLLRVNRKNNCAYAQFAFELLVIPFPCVSETRSSNLLDRSSVSMRMLHEKKKMKSEKSGKADEMQT